MTSTLPVSNDLTMRPRRLRQSAPLRRMVAHSQLEPRHLVLPIFVREDLEAPQEISTMPGVLQHTIDSAMEEAAAAVDAGLSGIMVFGVPAPDRKDATGSSATDPDGILNRAIRGIVAEVGSRIVVMSDLCLDEFTDHGHCGVINSRGEVDNDLTLSRYAEMSQMHAEAGAHMLGLSGMMDNQVATIRHRLDTTGFQNVGLIAYTAKYASVLYGPFREAINSSLETDRRTYQMDIANAEEADLETSIDIAQGADIVMVKPAMLYLDVLARVSKQSLRPVAAYQVSGEYTMIEAGIAAGVADRRELILESLTSIRRAGAQIVLTYWAIEAAHWLTDYSSSPPRTQE